MKTFFFLFITCVFGTNAFAQNLQWAKSLSGDGLYDQATSVAIDAAGNVYTTGLFQGTMDFDPGPATFNVTSVAATPDACDIFISKLDAAGNFVWTKTIGGLSYQRSLGRAIAVDAAGNIFITGAFVGAADFDPGAGIYTLTSTQTPFGSAACYILKLDPAGNFLWGKTITGSVSAGNAIAIDQAGTCYVTGYFTGTVDFDPGPAIYELTAAPTAIINSACFILKLDASGDFVWARSTFGNSGCVANSIKLDVAGNIYVGGGYSGKYDFDPTPATYDLTATGLNDAFIAKFDNPGNFLWVRSFGGGDNEQIENMAVDAFGNIFATGEFHKTADFDPGPGIYNLTATGTDNGDIFISKLDPAGNFLWAKSVGAAGNEAAYGIDFDSQNNLFICGTFSETVDFDPGPSTYDLISAGGPDIFIAKFDNAGNFLSAQKLGGTGDDMALSLKIDPSGNIYMAGDFSNVVDFDPASGIYNLTSTGGNDAFILKLSQPIVPITLLNFDVTKNKNDAYLIWRTATESNTNKFEVERSDDGNSFRKIGEINASGNSGSIKAYHFIDHNAGINFPGKNIYYRFKQIDLDGKFSLSPVRSVIFENGISLSIYPNPTTDIFIIETGVAQQGLNYKINDETGKLVLNGKLTGTSTVIDISQLSKGIYFVNVDRVQKAVKLIKQ